MYSIIQLVSIVLNKLGTKRYTAIAIMKFGAQTKTYIFTIRLFNILLPIYRNIILFSILF